MIKMPKNEMPEIEIKNALEGWVSPVELIYEDAKNTFLEQTDEHILARCEAVLGVKVDRDELIKAMNYDREQYKKGFSNGYAKRDEEIVRCEDCEHYQNHICRRISIDGEFNVMVAKSHFCAMGERKETE